MVGLLGNLEAGLRGDLGGLTQLGERKREANIEHRTPNIDRRREEKEELGTANLANLANLEEWEEERLNLEGR